MNKETEKEFEEKFRKYTDSKTFNEIKSYIEDLMEARKWQIINELGVLFPKIDANKIKLYEYPHAEIETIKVLKKVIKFIKKL
ncbi:MAG TPA: hypothetical protein ENI76_02610 [Ignavibacteria bacterium]|nr:hypothetical protein [Ignavibacteria bacterium]